MPAKSKARQMLEASQKKEAEDATKERRVRMTLVDTKAFEYHLNAFESVARGILDPDVPDTFIEVPIEPNLKGSVLHAYLHTSQIAKFYLHDELTLDAPTPEAKGG